MATLNQAISSARPEKTIQRYAGILLYMTGALSFCAVRELTRVVAPETEKQWLDAVADKPVRDIEPLVSSSSNTLSAKGSPV